jgi:DNA repair exonuclease SbcCD nuclease subunit
MKILVIGDPHFGRKADDPIIRDGIRSGQVSYFDYLIEKFIPENNISEVFITGDVFDTRISVDVQAMVDFKRLINAMCDLVPVTIITGNHDLVNENNYKYGILQLYTGMHKNLNIVYDTVQKRSIDNYDWYFVPWIVPDKMTNFVNFLEKQKKNKSKNVYFGHFEILGVDMESGMLSEHGLPQDLFLESSALTLSGHYHGKSLIEKFDSRICYVGSPMPFTFINAKTVHGVHVIDTETLAVEFHRNTISPIFVDVFDIEFDISNIDFNKSFIRYFHDRNISSELLVEQQLMIEAKKPTFLKSVPYGEYQKQTTNIDEIREKANKMLYMDTIKLSELYISEATADIPHLSTVQNPKQAILDRVSKYHEQIRKG